MEHAISWLNWPGFRPETINVVTGCEPCSPGCANCYADDQNTLHSLQPDFRVLTYHPDRLSRISRGGSPRAVFLDSMTDLYHPGVKPAWRAAIWDECRKRPQDIFFVLTKRPENIPADEWQYIPVNVCMGVSLCCYSEWNKFAQLYYSRPYVDQNSGHLLFLSAEPLLEPIPAIRPVPDWIIVGGESGPKARECKAEWMHELYQYAQSNKIPFFFKQPGRRGVGDFSGLPKEFPKSKGGPA